MDVYVFTGQGSGQRHDAGVLSVLPPSSGGAADRLNPVGVCDVCGCVPEALCAEVASGTNLYLDLKNGERDLVAEGEKGKLPQTGGSGEKASYHRMYTTWNVRLGRHKQDHLITSYYLLSTIYLNPCVRHRGTRYESSVGYVEVRRGLW